MISVQQEENRLVYHYDAEELWIEPWGENSLRVRATKKAEMPQRDLALLPPQPCRTARSPPTGHRPALAPPGTTSCR